MPSDGPDPCSLKVVLNALIAASCAWECRAKFGCNGACHFCADCLVAYSETLFEGRAQTQVAIPLRVSGWRRRASAQEKSCSRAHCASDTGGHGTRDRTQSSGQGASGWSARRKVASEWPCAPCGSRDSEHNALEAATPLQRAKHITPQVSHDLRAVAKLVRKSPPAHLPKVTHSTDTCEERTAQNGCHPEQHGGGD